MAEIYTIADDPVRDAAAPPVGLTAGAARRVAEIAAQQGNPKLKFRVAVQGGGCSGFQYEFKLEEAVGDDDIVIERDGVQMLVDSLSLLYLTGAEVDFVEDLIGAAFQVNNPNATASCGCGTSFSVM